MRQWEQVRKLLIKTFRNELQDNMESDKMAPLKNDPRDALVMAQI